MAATTDCSVTTGSAKPVALEMKEFNDFLANFEYASLPAHTTEAVCIVQRDTQDAWKIQNSAFILAKQRILT